MAYFLHIVQPLSLAMAYFLAIYIIQPLSIIALIRVLCTCNIHQHAPDSFPHSKHAHVIHNTCNSPFHLQNLQMSYELLLWCNSGSLNALRRPQMRTSNSLRRPQMRTSNSLRRPQMRTSNSLRRPQMRTSNSLRRPQMRTSWQLR